MTYETISINELTNRAVNVRTSGDCGIIDTPETFFSAQYWNESRKAWWNAFETTDQAEAEAKIALWVRQGSPLAKRIVIVVNHAEPIKATQATNEVVEQSVEVMEASIDGVVTAKPASTKTYMELNKTTHRYEAEVDGKLFCVEENAFADRLYAACNTSTDDEYRIWSVLTWLSSWDFSGKVPGVYILETANA